MAVFKIYLSDGITQLTNIKNVSFREAVNTGDDLRPGCVGSAAIEFEVFDTQDNAVDVGDVIFAYQIDKEENSTLLGKFNCEPVIQTKKSYKVAAYDNAQKLNADFSQWLQANQSNFPMTVYSLVSAACTVAGVTLGSASWGLSTQNVQAFYADGITCRDILSYAAELGGCFVRCHTDGKVYFDWYTANANTIAPSAGTGVYAYKQDGLTYDNYTTAALARVAVHPSGEDDVAYIYPTGVTSGNTLHIKNNLLLTGASASFYNAAAQQVYTAVSAVGQYSPMSVSLFPRENVFHAGDIVSITDAQSVTISAPVMSMMISNAAATLVSEGREYYEDTTETAKAITQLASDVVRINKLKVSWAEIDQAIINYLTTNNVTARNLTIVDSANNVLGTFNANGITIGLSAAGHAFIDYHSLKLYDRNGNIYFSADDERDIYGSASISETFVISQQQSMIIPCPVNTTLPTYSASTVKVYINGTLKTVGTDYNVFLITDYVGVSIINGCAEGDVVQIDYGTYKPVYRYVLGTTTGTPGMFSISGGRNVLASGNYSSVSGGQNNTASGEYSVVDGGLDNTADGDYSIIGGGRNNTASRDFSTISGGRLNEASGSYSSVGGGLRNEASGSYSSVGGGLYNLANHRSQMVFGEYNSADPSANSSSLRGDYVEIVGNGTSTNARSNARTLDWNGNETLAGGLTTGGGVVSDSYYTRKVPVPGANTTYLVCRLEDSNGDGRGGVGFITSNNYGEGTRLYHTRNGVVNGLALYVDSNGTPTVNLDQPGAWHNSLGYKAGDSIAFGTSGNALYCRFAGDWRNATDLYFTIPLPRSCVGLTATATGTLYVCSNNTRNYVTLSNQTVTCYTSEVGVTVRVSFASSPSYAVLYMPISVQPYGLTITFS